MDIFRHILKRFFAISAILVAIIGVIVICSTIYINLRSYHYIYKDIESLPEINTVIVLGAATLRNGKPAPVLHDRLITAHTVYEKKTDIHKIIVSGDDTQGSYLEATPMKQELIREGVPAENIVVDPEGVDTYSTMYRAKNVYGVTKAVIVTQDFHLPRALYIAHEMGIEAYGISADRRQYANRNTLREMLANIKAMLELTFPSLHAIIVP